MYIYIYIYIYINFKLEKVTKRSINSKTKITKLKYF